MTDRLRPGDRVRAGVEGYYIPGRYAGEDPHVKADNGQTVYLPPGWVVEVIEPADDPSKDPVGTVRRRNRDGWLFIKWIDDESELCWLVLHDPSARCPSRDLSGEGTEIIGAVLADRETVEQFGPEPEEQT